MKLSQGLKNREHWYLLALLAVMICGAAALAVRQYSRQYPYGREHCCDKALGLALLNYAHDNGGRFPAGGATPEASLSLLYPKYLDASILRGKGCPEEPVRKLLEAGQPLTPATCGWQYVDGLTLSQTNSSRLVIFWDKIGLDHNSGILPHGGHSVTFMDAHGMIINQPEWQRFIAEQQAAWTAIRGGTPPPQPWIPYQP